jgi:hypothetical protein
MSTGLRGEVGFESQEGILRSGLMKFVARFTSSLRFLIIFALVPLWREPLVRAAPGINYRITSVSVAGASALGEDRAKRVLELRVGSRTTDDGVEHALAALTREYHRHGFIKVSLSIEKSVTPATAGHEYPRLSLKLNVTEGKAYYIARLTFDGNAITNGDVVQKATALDLYKPYNPDDTYRWIKDLNRLGRFYPLSEKDVEVEIDDQAHKVFLTFHLKERGRDSTTPPVGQISFAAQGRHDHRDYVPDSKTAERIAEAVLIAQYGEERVTAQLPLVASMSGKDRCCIGGAIEYMK